MTELRTSSQARLLGMYTCMDASMSIHAFSLNEERERAAPRDVACWQMLHNTIECGVILLIFA